MSTTNCHLCVLKVSQSASWEVVLCGGDRPGATLGRFDSFSEAAEFAAGERDRRATTDEPVQTIHFPDDCPCYQQGKCP